MFGSEVYGEVALYVRGARVSQWTPVLDGKVQFPITEFTRALDVQFQARIPQSLEGEMFIPVYAFVLVDLHPGDTLILERLQLDLGDMAIGGFHRPTDRTDDEELPDPDEDYDEEPFSDVRPDEET